MHDDPKDVLGELQLTVTDKRTGEKKEFKIGGTAIVLLALAIIFMVAFCRR